MANQTRIVCLTAVLVTVISACGYHFAGGGSLPAGVSQVFIPMFENRSSETGVESRFTNDLLFEFTRHRKESIASDRSSADGILNGTIASLFVDNVSMATVSVAVERRVTCVMRLQMVSPDGRIVWASGNIVESHAYSVADGNKTATDQNKSDAIAVVSKKVAETAFNRLTDDF